MDSALNQPPVRLCCGERHDGVVCPDGTVMCCLCFFKIPVDDLATEDGVKINVCRPCAKAEESVIKLTGGNNGTTTPDQANR